MMKIAVPFLSGPVNQEMRRRIREAAQGGRFVKILRGDNFHYAVFVWGD